MKSWPRFRWRWLDSAPFDLCFLVLPLWVPALYLTCLKLFPKQGVLLFLVVNASLGEPHFASTWTVYLDSENRAHFSRHKWIYYFIPLILFAGTISSVFFLGFGPTLIAGAIASAFHVTRQSTGIVALYRDRGGNPMFAESKRARRMENAAIYLASAGFLAIGAARFYLPRVFSMGAGQLRLLYAVAFSSIGLAGLLLGQCVLGEVQRASRDRRPVSLSKLSVLSYSLFVYSPFLFAQRPEHAAVMGVGMHHLQYLGIVALLQGNKAKAGQASPFSWSELLGRRLSLRVGYLLIYGLGAVGLRLGFSHDLSFDVLSYWYCIPLGAQAVHYYLDAFLWRFSNPFFRRTVLPYLAAQTQPA